MPSDVFFINFRASMKEPFFEKLEKLVSSAGLADVLSKRDLTAVKIHFGEMGNSAFVRPLYVREIVKAIKKTGATAFLTDANTLYAGARGNSVEHIETAMKNGFAYTVVGAPIIIADGLRGRSQTGVEIAGKHFDTVYIGSDIVNADALVSIAHFKGHELSGFGGTLKNVGMGSASRHGKLEQHSGIAPKVKHKRCIGCKACVNHCSQGAISINAENKAVIDEDACIGCGECILMCAQEAIQVRWSKSIPDFMEKMVEYVQGVLHNKQGKALFVNFITDVSPACDCLPVSDAPIVRNIGILASRDPVAIDQASVDLVNAEPALAGSCLKEGREAGGDKFNALYPKVDWTLQLEYARQLNLGSRDYRLVEI
ncbi:MAG: DUF362 domain-containing protein [Deltaproteobacteria bacterium]|nr:DUF362 domain-containing protein [Deltaproteobacteria bacterium]